MAQIRKKMINFSVKVFKSLKYAKQIITSFKCSTHFLYSSFVIAIINSVYELRKKKHEL